MKFARSPSLRLTHPPKTFPFISLADPPLQLLSSHIVTKTPGATPFRSPTQLPPWPRFTDPCSLLSDHSFQVKSFASHSYEKTPGVPGSQGSYLRTLRGKRLPACRRQVLPSPGREQAVVLRKDSRFGTHSLARSPSEVRFAAPCSAAPNTSQAASAIHSAMEKCPGNAGISFIAKRISDTTAPSAAIPRIRALDSTSASDPQAASHPKADAIDPTSVTGTSSASPKNTPSSVPPAIARIATPGVWNAGCNLPNRAGTVPRLPNENSSRLAATKFPLKHWHNPSVATTKIRLTGQRAPIACSNAIAVANLFPSSDCHGAATETAAIANT